MKRGLKKVVLILSVLPIASLSLIAQKTKAKPSPEMAIPMEPAYWKYDTAVVEFTTLRGVKAIHLKTGAPMFLKNGTFSNGTIEYDVEIVRGFPGVVFRQSADGKQGDNFYLRYFGVASPDMRTAIQYAAIYDGMSLWDLTDEYQGGTTLNIPGWNHVKLVVSGKQMRAYVNDMSRPALIVPELEGGTDGGGISFSGGDVTIANVVIKPDAVENLDAAMGYISIYNDTRYLRHWQVTASSEFAPGKEIIAPVPYLGRTPVKPDLPDSTTKWMSIAAEDRGIVNLTRLYGAPKTRRLAWLKTTIESDKAQERILNLGFSDEVWVFVNGQILYSDKNHFGSPGQKYPAGRCTIENSTVKLPLKEGKNEILIALANYFYGWGIIARIDETEGIHLATK